MRGVAAGVVLAGLALGSAACTSGKSKPSPTQPPGRPGVNMMITPSKSTYSRGEPVVLTIVLRNGDRAACRVGRVPDGMITFLSFTRDGIPVVPVVSSADYINGLASFMITQLVPLAPGASLTLSMPSESVDSDAAERPALRTTMLEAQGAATLAFWPVGEPGTYELSARYAVPPLPEAPTDVCPTSGDPALAKFAVAGG